MQIFYFNFYCLFTCIQKQILLCLDNRAYKIKENQMIDYLDENPFETDKD